MPLGRAGQHIGVGCVTQASLALESDRCLLQAFFRSQGNACSASRLATLASALTLKPDMMCWPKWNPEALLFVAVLPRGNARPTVPVASLHHRRRSAGRAGGGLCGLLSLRMRAHHFLVQPPQRFWNAQVRSHWAEHL